MAKPIKRKTRADYPIPTEKLKKLHIQRTRTLIDRMDRTRTLTLTNERKLHSIMPKRKLHTKMRKQLHNPDKIKKMMLEGLEKELIEPNSKNILMTIGTYSWLYDDLTPVYELIRKYNFSEQMVKDYLSPKN